MNQFMSVVIDANVFHAFLYETIRDEVHPERTASPMPLFHSLGVQAIAFVDEGGQIEAEWRTLCGGANEWFDTWLAECFSEGRIYAIEPSKDATLSKRYHAVGFPRGKDMWYIKVVHGLAGICNRNKPTLVAEDVDFYDPTKKRQANKKAIFKAGKGPVCSAMKIDGIMVKCIQTVCNELEVVG
ncbi:MAG: hypothetical protein EON54_03610 [Alcaligenaceae bacterium]|nr:MAG: hypothetical protein EON54_03610 [Alcaligenaceae bacterium]